MTEPDKQLYEIDPLRLSIAQISQLDEATKVFPGEKDGKGMSAALQHRQELIND